MTGTVGPLIIPVVDHPAQGMARWNTAVLLVTPINHTYQHDRWNGEERTGDFGHAFTAGPDTCLGTSGQKPRPRSIAETPMLSAALHTGGPHAHGFMAVRFFQQAEQNSALKQ